MNRIMSNIKSFILWFKERFSDTGGMCIAICMTTIILYIRSLSFDYTGLDDIPIVFDRNEELRKLGIGLFFRDFFLTGVPTSASFYRPLALFPFIIASWMAGTSLWAYHLSTLLMHMAAGLSVFFLFFSLGGGKKVSFIASIVFICSPAAAGSVGFVSNIPYPMLAAFVSLSFIFGIEYIKKKKNTMFFLHLLFFAMAMFTVESAIGFVPAFLFYLFFASSCKEKNEKIRNLVSFSVSYLIILASWFIFRRMVIGGAVPQNVIGTSVHNLPSLFAMLRNFFLPFFMRPLAHVGLSASIIPGVAFAAALVLLPFSVYVKEKRIYAAGAVFFISFAFPTILSGYEFNDMPHRLYMPSIGLLIMLLQIDWISLLCKKHYIFAVAFITMNMVCSVRILGYYSGGEKFWSKIIEDNPEYVQGYRGLMEAFQRKGEHGKALDIIETLIKKYPDNPEYKFLYAGELVSVKRLQEATDVLENLVINYPSEPAYLSNYANLLREMGDNEKSVFMYRKCLDVAPDYQQCHYGYGHYLLSSSRWKEAESEYRISLSVNSDPRFISRFDYAQCRKNLSYTILKQAELEKELSVVLSRIKDAVVFSPDADVYEHAAYILIEKGEYEASEKMFVLALNAEPGRITSATGAGLAAAKAGNVHRAEEYLHIALKIDPENAKAREILEKIRPFL